MAKQLYVMWFNGIRRVWHADPDSDKPVYVASYRDGRSVWMVKGKLVYREADKW